MSHPDGRSRCRTLLVTVTQADGFAAGKLEKTWLERAASARRPRGDQRRRNSDVGGAGGERYCFYLHRRGDGSWCTDACGWHLGAARRGWLAGTAAQFPDVAVTPYHPACPPPESQWFCRRGRRFALASEPASLPTLTLQDLLHKIHNGKTAHLLCRTIELTGPPETRTIVTKPLCIF